MNIGLITARGGSKGLPRKNVLELNGLPLIAWTIKAAIESRVIDKIYVSTEDAEIAQISKEYGAEIIERPIHLASDTASSIEVVSHAITWLDEQNISCKSISLLQPTSPLRTAKHLNEAVNLFNSRSADFVISVFEPAHTPIKSYIECEDGTIVGLFSNDAPYLRRQDLPRAFQPNGAIYVFLVDEFKRNNHFPRKNTFPYLMSEFDSTDIDTLEDLIVVGNKLKEFNK